MHSVQRKVELRRLGNQLPVLGKADSLCKIVKLCVFCMYSRFLRFSIRSVPLFRSLMVTPMVLF